MEEYLKKGKEILGLRVLSGICDIAEKYPEIGTAMMKFWTGEISWEEQIDMITDGYTKRIRDEINTTMYKKSYQKQEFKRYVNKIC
jgi:hypothetical protein